MQTRTFMPDRHIGQSMSRFKRKKFENLQDVRPIPFPVLSEHNQAREGVVKGCYPSLRGFAEASSGRVEKVSKLIRRRNYFSNTLHLIWSPQSRKPFTTPDIEIYETEPDVQSEGLPGEAA